MKFLFIIFLLSLSLPALACLNLKAVMRVNDEELTIDQKVDYQETYSFMKGPYIINVRMAEGPKKDSHLINIDVDRREANGMKEVSRAKIISLNGQEAEMSSVNQEQEKMNVKLTLKRI